MRRNHYFFIAPEEVDDLIKAAELPIKDFKWIEFSNVPKGNKRYLLCSKQIEDQLLEKNQ